MSDLQQDWNNYQSYDASYGTGRADAAARTAGDQFRQESYSSQAIALFQDASQSTSDNSITRTGQQGALSPDLCSDVFNYIGGCRGCGGAGCPSCGGGKRADGAYENSGCACGGAGCRNCQGGSCTADKCNTSGCACNGAGCENCGGGVSSRGKSDTGSSCACNGAGCGSCRGGGRSDGRLGSPSAAGSCQGGDCDDGDGDRDADGKDDGDADKGGFDNDGGGGCDGGGCGGGRRPLRNILRFALGTVLRRRFGR